MAHLSPAGAVTARWKGTLEMSQLRGSRPGTLSPSLAHALDVYRPLGSALPPLNEFHAFSHNKVLSALIKIARKLTRRDLNLCAGAL